MSDKKDWAPARIWLQRGVGDDGSHTWCSDSQGEHEQAEYVRVDVQAPAVEAGARDERASCASFKCALAQRDDVPCRDGECERAQIDGAPCWEDECDIVTRGRAAPSSASEAAEVPAGYKLVPAEPTVEMLNAALPHDVTFGHGFKRRIYQEMIAAAPQPAIEPASSCDPADICAGCRCKYNTYAQPASEQRETKPAGNEDQAIYQAIADNYAKDLQAEQQAAAGWVSVADRLPESGKTVLATYQNRLGKLRRIRAQYIGPKTREHYTDYDELDGEYDETTDTYYWAAGWYECIDNWDDYSHVSVSEGNVTHWMPMPDAPALAAAKGDGQ